MVKIDTRAGRRWPRRRSRWSMVGIVGAALVVAAGCGSSGSKASSGNSGGGGGGGNKTITIGLDSVLSGPDTSLASLPDGAQAYFDSVNAKGGIDGYKIKTVTVDTAYQGPQAVAVTKQLQDDDHANAVLGIGTVPMTALHAVASEFHIPIFIGADGSLFVPANKYFFDVSPDYYRMWAMAESEAKNYLHASSVSVVYQNDAVGTPVQQGTQAWAKQNGFKVDAEIAVESTATDCSPQAARLKSAGAPVVIIGALGPPTACVMKAAQTIGYNPQWVTNYEGKDPGETSLLSNALLSKLFFLDYGIPLTETSNPAVSTYLATMKQKYPQYATAEFAQQGWSMGSVLVAAIQMATAGGKAFTESAFVDALNNGFHGQAVAMLPSVTYDSTQHYSTTQMDFNTYTPDGQVKVLTGFIPMPPSPVPGK